MKTNYILVDCENVYPNDLAMLLDKAWCRILLFIGKNQTKIPLSLAMDMQKLGERAGYVEITGSGHNALDFHIAYYIGRISATNPDSFFHIVSKDNGYDPLIEHLKMQKIFADRVNDIQSIRAMAICEMSSKPIEEKLAFAKERLQSGKGTRPRTRKTLMRHLSAMFGKNVPEDEIELIVQGLFQNGVVKEKGSRLEYFDEGC